MPPGLDEQFEQHLQAASKYSAETAWEHALKEIEEAQALTKREEFPPLPGDAAELRILIQRGTLERRLGNYKRAAEMLREATQHFEHNDPRHVHLEVLGELGVALLRQDDFAQASDTFQHQYELAKSAVLEAGERKSTAPKKALAYACHAVGNRALAVFQMAVPDLDAPETVDGAQLALAMQLLDERIERATSIRAVLRGDLRRSGIWNMATAWQSEALDRLTLCHLATGDTSKALECGCKSVALSEEQPESTVRGLSRFYYGMAVYYSGRESEAFELWSQTGDKHGCTAAMALSREPSNENTERLRLVAKHGIGFLRHDEHGYSVLDYTVLGGNERMKAVAIEGLRQELSQFVKNGQHLDATTIEARIAYSVVEAQRRNKYRETYQLTFRPILSKLSNDRGIARLSYRPVSRWTLARGWLRSATFFPLGRSSDEIYIYQHSRRQDGIDKLRKGYLRQRETNVDTRTMFDRLVVLRYQDFKKKMTRLPRPDCAEDMEEVVHLRKGYSSDPQDSQDTQPPFIIFLSYRWLGKGSPDNEHHTQHTRMLHALDTYLTMHPWLDRKQVSVWLVRPHHRPPRTTTNHHPAGRCVHRPTRPRDQTARHQRPPPRHRPMQRPHQHHRRRIPLPRVVLRRGPDDPDPALRVRRARALEL